MPENKTIPNDQNVEHFLDAVADEQRRKDSFTLLKIMREVTGLAARLWGSSIVGFGSYHYRYESGREGDMILAGFSPRKQSLVIYNMGSVDEDDQLFRRLGEHTMGKGCLYIKRLDDIDLPTLKSLIEESFKRVKEKAEAK
jgi:hypothetical protein